MPLPPGWTQKRHGSGIYYSDEEGNERVVASREGAGVIPQPAHWPAIPQAVLVRAAVQCGRIRGGRTIMSETHTYVLRAPCGCIRGAVVDDGSPSVPAFVADGIKRGYTAIHLSSAFVREQSWTCDSTGCPYRKAATR